MEMIVDEVQTGMGSTGNMWLVICDILYMPHTHMTVYHAVHVAVDNDDYSHDYNHIYLC